MSSRVEIEAKYFLEEAEKLKQKIKEMNFREDC